MTQFGSRSSMTSLLRNDDKKKKRNPSAFEEPLNVRPPSADTIQRPPVEAPPPVSQPPAPSGLVGPPVDVGGDRLDAYRRDLIRSMDALTKQRILLGQSGDRAAATALGIRERELRDQLYQANRLKSDATRLSPEQVQAGRAQLQAQLPAAQASYRGQLQSDLDVARARREEAARYFTGPRPAAGETTLDLASRLTPVSTPYPLSGGTNSRGQSIAVEAQVANRRTPREQITGDVAMRAQNRNVSEAQRALSEYNPTDQLDFGPLNRRPLASEYERADVAGRIAEFEKRRQAEIAQAGLDQQYASEKARADIATEIARRQTAERIGSGQDTGALEERGRRAAIRTEAARATTQTSPDQILQSAEAGYANLEGLDWTNVAEMNDRIQAFRDTVLGPLADYAVEDPAGAARAAEQIKARLRAVAVGRRPGIGSALGIGGTGMATSYAGIAAAISSLVSEIDNAITPQG